MNTKSVEQQFEELVGICTSRLVSMDLADIYSDRLEFEIDQINQQGLERYWVEKASSGEKFFSNPNRLLFPWLLGLCVGELDVNPYLGDEDHMATTINYKAIAEYDRRYDNLPPGIYRDSDVPDIDLDCLPEARDKIKEYASHRFGSGNVASVGTWMTYKYKTAITDLYAACGLAQNESDEDFKALGVYRRKGQNLSEAVTSKLPEDINNLRRNGLVKCVGQIVDGKKSYPCGVMHDSDICPKCGSAYYDGSRIEDLCNQYDLLMKFAALSINHNNLLFESSSLIGCIRNKGMHAGAIIISDRPLHGNVPMSFDAKKKMWISSWTEGSNTQLSKFGYNKWDILGLSTMSHVTKCADIVKHNHGLDFGVGLSGLDDVDPNNNVAGSYLINGNKNYIKLDDPDVFAMINERKVSATFQFDTPLARRILKNGVRSFHDLMTYSALGHPGPMEMIPTYVARRDGEDPDWANRVHPAITSVLHDTYAVVVYQEQLTDLWMTVAGFNSPEAQQARKAVAKKKKDQVAKIQQKWVDGASSVIGEEEAKQWWDILEAFSSYAFNKSHAVAYTLLAYHCMWFKAHFPEEWYSVVIGDSKPDDVTRFIMAARSEGISVRPVDIDHITMKPVAFSGSRVQGGDKFLTTGLMNMKGIGYSVASLVSDDSPVLDEKLRAPAGGWQSFEQFIEVRQPRKTVVERLVKLGICKKFSPNRRALWMYYLYHYSSGSFKLDGKEIKASDFKKQVHQLWLDDNKWTQERIDQEKSRQIGLYFDRFPKRKKIPTKLQKWMPSMSTDVSTFCRLFADDYSKYDILQFEKEYLGYYDTSPLEMYNVTGECDIKSAKECGVLEGIVTGFVVSETKTGKEMGRMTLYDGHEIAEMVIWGENIHQQIPDLLKVDAAVRAIVSYDDSYDSFSLSNRCPLMPLELKSS